ncbi:hypothetical protein [Novosphingobium sp.]|uniref:hypothetical protein n=1 Tax=Novosphingobium sp. TaxID=1874826 RepID=UPI00262527A6|nr:hypothetical protein [Novosphingobium sp.]
MKVIGPDIDEITRINAILNSGRHVLVLSMAGCSSCSALKRAIDDYMAETTTNYPLIWINLARKKDASAIGINQLRGVPLIVGVDDGQFVFGWEGFAAHAPSELEAALVAQFLGRVDRWLNGAGL